ncbi:MAG: heme ABC exporter ATP-binding protein CcmA [Burkholderiales bacterium 28-67-8]|nr:MAG: heme ABC exporter ATP-binding protein CcmA [Burkholderiales bacterium 28-67-8]
MPAPASLELTGLSCTRGSRRLFPCVDRSVRAGELMRVQGPNGAGKTTLLRTLCGLSMPAEGEVRWCGQAVARQRDSFHRDLIYIGHAACLKDDLTARENLLAACLLGGQHPDEAQVLAALRVAGLRQREHLSARSLSQGQRRRVSLARLVLGEASRLWVLDEPFNALDTDATAWLLGVLEAQLRRGGIVVLTSHMPVAIDPSLPQVVLSL